LSRLISFLLFGLLLYNMMGFSVAYLLEEQHSLAGAPEGTVEKGLYTGDIVIKVPVSLPYQVNYDHPEPIEGNILHNGDPYRMRTRQLINDTLYIHCEFDQNARDRFVSLVSKIQDEVAADHPSKKSTSTLLKQFLKEFLAVNRSHIFYLLEWVPAHGHVPDLYHFAVVSHNGNIHSPPPDQL